MVSGVRCDVDIFKLTASAQSIYREVYDRIYNFINSKYIGLCTNFGKISICPIKLN